MPDWVAEQTKSLDELEEEWRSLELQRVDRDRKLVAGWSRELTELSALEWRLRAAGRWISGPTDLMGVLEVERDEVKHCRALAWLLNPHAAHGLGDRFLRSFLGDLRRRGVIIADEHDLGGVSVTKEELRGATRADVVVRSPGWTVLIEAKILAGEQPSQGARLEELWADEEPVFVFLTKTGKPMRTGSERWLSYTWREVAGRLREAIAEMGDELLASRSYLMTLEAHLR